MRIATWNVNSLKARLGRVEEWLATVAPDVLCLQETKLADASFPGLTFQALGYEGVHHGQGRWNGVAILSRVGIDDVVFGFADGGPSDSVPGFAGAAAPGATDAEARLLTATCGGVRVVTVYVPNGRAVGHEQFHLKLAWLGRLRQHVAAVTSPDAAAVVLGDFNVAPDDRDVWNATRVHGATHVTPEERAHVAALAEWGLVDVLRRQFDEPGLYSWWDYRAGDFHQRRGMRIDLMLATGPLADRTEWCLIDRNARKGKAPSDHAPLVAQFALPTPLEVP